MFPGAAGWVVQGGAFGVLLLAVWYVLTGRIVPRATLELERSDKRIWQDTAQTALKTAQELSGHVDKLVDTSQQLVAAQRDTQQLVRQLIGPAGTSST